MLLAALLAITVTLTWWLICSRLPRIGVLGSGTALIFFTVGLFRARNAPPIVDPALPTELGDMLVTCWWMAPLLVAAIGLAIAVTRWTEAR